MNKTATKALLVPLIIVVIVLWTTIAPADYQIVNWARNAFNSNHADSVLTQAGTFRPVWEVISGDTVAQSYRADSAKWGGVYKTLAQILPDSFALFLRLHAQADSARSADTAYTLQGMDTTKVKGLLVENAASAANAKNADSLNHYYPDFPVSLMAESLAVKAKAASPVFTGLGTLDSAYIKYGFRIDAGYGGKLGVVTYKDTMGMLGFDSLSLLHGAMTAGLYSMFPSINIRGNAGHLFFDTTGNPPIMKWNGSSQFYGGDFSTTGLTVQGTSFTAIWSGNATGWTAQNTIDTNRVVGVTAGTRIGSLVLRAETATLTAPLCGRTVADTLFISCAAADTAAVRAGSVDYTLFR